MPNKPVSEIYAETICKQIKKLSPCEETDEQWIVTPFLDQHNDFISILVKTYDFDDGVYVSDGGFLFCEFVSKNGPESAEDTKNALGYIVSGVGLSISEDGDIFDWADNENDLFDVINNILRFCITVCTGIEIGLSDLNESSAGIISRYQKSELVIRGEHMENKKNRGLNNEKAEHDLCYRRKHPQETGTLPAVIGSGC